MAFMSLFQKMFKKSKKEREYDEALKKFNSRQPKNATDQATPIPKESSVDDDIKAFQDRQRKIREKTAPFRR